MKRIIAIVILLFVVSGFIGWSIGHDDQAAFYMTISHQQGQIEILEKQLADREHSIWHLQEKQDQYYTSWQNALQELIDSGVYEETFRVEFGDNLTGSGWISSYEKK